MTHPDFRVMADPVWIDEDRGMSKRMLSATLWFAAAWFGYEIAWSLTGVPRLVGPILAFAIAAFVAIDPLGLLWPRRAAAPLEETTQAPSAARFQT